VAELKALESKSGVDFDSELDKAKEMIDAEPSAIVATTKIQPNEQEELEEAERLFLLANVGEGCSAAVQYRVA
jgi:hypothetical protein